MLSIFSLSLLGSFMYRPSFFFFFFFYIKPQFVTVMMIIITIMMIIIILIMILIIRAFDKEGWDAQTTCVPHSWHQKYFSFLREYCSLISNK